MRKLLRKLARHRQTSPVRDQGYEETGAEGIVASWIPLEWFANLWSDSRAVVDEGTGRTNQPMMEAFSGAHHFKMQGDITVVGGNLTQTKNVHVYSNNMDALSAFPVPIGTSWDIARTCLPGTRTHIIQEVVDWVSNIPSGGGAGIYLLADAAGSGKTALAHSISESSAANTSGWLIASFFFNRLKGEHSTTRYLLAALLRGLCQANAGARNTAIRCLEQDSSLATAPSTRQFESLIVPVCETFPHGQPQVVVIDALDEGYDADLMMILRDHVARLPSNFRFVLTSRPEAGIMWYLDGKPHVTRCRTSLSGAGSLEDVGKLIRSALLECEELCSISVKVAEEFIEKSEGVFLWAATVLNHVKQAFDPASELEKVLNADSGYWSSDQNAGQKLDTLYGQVLSRLAWNDPVFVEAYTKVMGAIITLKEPLPANALAELYMIEKISFKTVLKVATCVQSLLTGFDPDNPVEPLRVLHLSVREYLTERAPHPYRIIKTDHVPPLCRAMLFVITRDLNSDNIPNLGYSQKPWLFDYTFPTLDAKHIPPHLSYSCRFLVEHLLSINPPAFCRADIPLLTHVTSIKFIELLETTARLESVSDIVRLRAWELEVPTPRDQSFDALVLEHGAALLHLAHLLNFECRTREALIVSTYYLDVCQRVTQATSPPLHRLRLAEALVSIGASYLANGNYTDGRQACEEAVAIARQYSEMDRPCEIAGNSGAGLQQLSTWGTRARYVLSKSLLPLALCLGNQGESSRAVIAIEESIAIMRHLAAEKAGTYEGTLAVSGADTSNFSFRLLKFHDAWQAITAVQDIRYRAAFESSTERAQWLADELSALAFEYLSSDAVATRPSGGSDEALCNDLEDEERSRGRAFIEIGRWFLELRMYESALSALTTSLHIFRSLLIKEPNDCMARSHLVRTLLHIAERFLGRVESPRDALEAIEEALLWWGPEDEGYEDFLGYALYGLSLSLYHLKDFASALQRSEEAVAVCRQLAIVRQNSDETLRRLASSLKILSMCQSVVGRRDAALNSSSEMLDIYRQIAIRDPRTPKKDLGFALSIHSVALHNMKRLPCALQTIKESVTILREHAARDPYPAAGDLPTALRMLYLYQTEMGETDGVLEAVEEEIAYRRQFPIPNSDHQNRLVAAFHSLSWYQTKQGNHGAALEAKQEQVECFRRCPMFDDAKLADLLKELSDCFTKVNEHDSAAKVLEESHAIYNRLGITIDAS